MVTSLWGDIPMGWHPYGDIRRKRVAHEIMLAIQHLAPGTRLKLTDGGLAEIRENPRDGTWLIVRRLAPEAGSEDELLIVDDIAEIVPD
jgi:hypothetical protein